MKKIKPKILVIRGIRPSEAIFYNAFNRMDVTFIYFSQDILSYPIILPNIKLINTTVKSKYFIEPFALLSHGKYNNRSLIEIIGIEEYIRISDVVCISDIFYSWSDQVASLCKKYSKKLITIVWETIPHHLSAYIPPYSFYTKNVMQKTDLYILRSNSALYYTDSLGIPREKVRVIYKGVDLYLFKPLNKVKKNGEYSSIKILYVGQLNKEKGLDDLICAFIKLYKEFPQLELLLAGSGPYEKVINKVIDKYPIKLLGFVSYNELPGIYRQADIFCSPSKSVNFLGIKIWEELFSYTLMEAQASGLPIIATRCGGIPEEIAKENLLVDQGDTRALYSCLKEFIQSPEKGIKIGKINRERAESFFDLQKQAEATEEAILSIL